MPDTAATHGLAEKTDGGTRLFGFYHSMNMFIPLVSFRTVEPDLVGWKYTEARFSIPFRATTDTVVHPSFIHPLVFPLYR